jgi:hypothetical protein
MALLSTLETDSRWDGSNRWASDDNLGSGYANKLNAS